MDGKPFLHVPRIHGLLEPSVPVFLFFFFFLILSSLSLPPRPSPFQLRFLIFFLSFLFRLLEPGSEQRNVT